MCNGDWLALPVWGECGECVEGDVRLGLTLIEGSIPGISSVGSDCMSGMA